MKFSIPIVFGFDRAAENEEFLWENVGNSVKNYIALIEDVLLYVKKQNFLNRQMNHFSPLCQLQLPISQNRPVACFVGVHHISFN